MKYTTMLNKLKDVAVKIFYTIILLILLALVGVVAYVYVWLDLIILEVMLMPLLIVAIGLMLNLYLARVIIGARYDTRIIIDVYNRHDVIRGQKYYQGKKFINFFQCLLFIGNLVYCAYNIQTEMWWAIAGIVIFGIGAIIYFMLGFSSIERRRLLGEIEKELSKYLE